MTEPSAFEKAQDDNFPPIASLPGELSLKMAYGMWNAALREAAKRIGEWKDGVPEPDMPEYDTVGARFEGQHEALEDAANIVKSLLEEGE